MGWRVRCSANRQLCGGNSLQTGQTDPKQTDIQTVKGCVKKLKNRVFLCVLIWLLDENTQNGLVTCLEPLRSNLQPNKSAHMPVVMSTCVFVRLHAHHLAQQKSTDAQSAPE